MAFRDTLIRLGYIYPVLSLRSTSCLRCMISASRTRFWLGEAQDDGEMKMFDYVGGLHSLHTLFYLLKSTYC